MAQRATGRRTGSTVTGEPDVARVVAVTGATGGLGSVVAERLARSGFTVRRAADMAGDLAGDLGGAEALVHLALKTDPDLEANERRDHNVASTQQACDAAVAAGVRHVVFVTSAAVFGADPANPVPLDDDAPLVTIADGLVGDFLAVEAIAANLREQHASVRVTVLRPATVVGAGADSVATRHFSSPRLLALREPEMRWQFAHVDDVASAVAVVLSRTLTDDTMTVASEGWLSQREVETLTGKGRLEVPASVAFATAERLYRARLAPFPASDLAYVVYPWVVTSARLRAAGWVPAYDNSTALGALMADLPGLAVAGRRVGRSEATIAGAGAAGATVAAVLGAAAFVRKARRARGR